MLLIAVLVGAIPAHADPGLTVASSSRYVLDAEDQTVSATISMTLRNVAPDESIEDGVRFFYYDSYGIPLPAEATQVQARSEGVSLQVERRAITGEDAYRLFEISFPDLLYQNSRTIELTFTLQGQPPRSGDPTRIGQGYATFPVFGPGDAGENTVEVVVPEEMTVDSTASSFVSSPGEEGTTVYTSREDNLAPGFAATMSVRGENVGEERSVTVGGVSLVLVPYPSDPEWADFIEARADVGLPVLMDLLGQEWPGDIDRIREDSGNQVRGFEGWYSTIEREIVLGEALDDGVLFHELAHAWVNSSTVEDRWLSEGLAEFLAEETARRTDGSFTVPAAVDPDARVALPLQAWEDSPGFRGTEVDGWAYPASYQVVSGLFEGVTDEALRPLLHDVITATSPWDLPGQRSLSGGAVSTRTFLDLLDAHEAPASTDGTSARLYATWVLGDDDAARLEQRAAAREAYAEFAAISSWGAPLGVRAAMAGWDYDSAQQLMTQLSDLAAAATIAQDLADAAATELPARVQTSYENADSEEELSAAAASISAATTALERYEQARGAADGAIDGGVLTRLGATVLRVEATVEAAQDNIPVGAFDASVAASELALQRSAWATRVGMGLVGAALAVLAIVALLVVVIRRRLRRPVALA